MSTDAAADPIAAIAAAEASALAEHEAGTCHLSEWSCSHCEAESGARSDVSGSASGAPVMIWRT